MSSKHEAVSLVDLEYCHSIDVWAVFVDMDENHLRVARSPFWRWLRPGFQHVEIWKPLPIEGWLRIDTSVEAAVPQYFKGPPWEQLKRLNPTSIRVRRSVTNGKWRNPFFIGPVTCVETAKAFLGVASLFIRTPYQLYKFLRKSA